MPRNSRKFKICGNLRGRGEGHPEDQDKLEGVVKGEPVNGVNGALENTGKGSVQLLGLSELLAPGGPHLRQERIDHPVLRYRVSQNSPETSRLAASGFRIEKKSGGAYRQPLFAKLA